MKRRFRDEQIITMIKERESGIPTTEICRKYRISAARFYKYNSGYGDMRCTAGGFTAERRRFECKKLKVWEEKNNKLKRLLVEQMLDNTVSKNVNSKE